MPRSIPLTSKIARALLGEERAGFLAYYLRPRLRNRWGGPFNGQRQRQQIFRDVLAAMPFSAIVETGTYRGDTTVFLRSESRLPVFTVLVCVELKVEGPRLKVAAVIVLVCARVSAPPDPWQPRGHQQQDPHRRDQIPVPLEHVVVAHEHDRQRQQDRAGDEDRRLLEGKRVVDPERRV